MATTKQATEEQAPKTAEKKKQGTKMPAAVKKAVPDLVTMLEAGVHFGHEKSKRNPQMEPYIFMHRERVAIIDLEQTRDLLERAARFAYETASTPGADILFVGTKRQVRPIVQKYAELVDQPYVTKRWLGGTLTNFETILKSIEKLEELKRTEDSPQVAKLTKKERGIRTKEINRLEAVLEGMKEMKALPKAIFVVGAHDQRIAVKEARRVGIPVIGIADTNADPAQLDYPIPGNDDAVRSLDLLVGTITKSILIAQGRDPKEVKDMTTAAQSEKGEETKAEASEGQAADDGETSS